MRVTELELKEVKIIEPKIFEDHRGYYMESYSAKTMEEHGFSNVFVQDNHILSIKKGTLRGIHFQNSPKAQAKLLRCTRGAILDVVVDLRADSPNFRKWTSVILDEDNKKQIYIPKGFGHGCISLVDNTEVQYKVDELYSPEHDRTIAWNDEELGIEWGTDSPILSEKDAGAPSLKNSDVNFLMENLL